MFQRKQSLYLIASIVLLIVSLLLPLGGNEELSVSYFGIEALTESSTVQGNIIFGGVGVLLGLILYVVALIMFNNRKLQMTMVKMASLLTVLGVAFTVYIINLNSFNIPFVIAIPLVAVMLSLLAHKFIKKDEDLIKSVDRIR